jgi:hypothetical protein
LSCGLIKDIGTVWRQKLQTVVNNELEVLLSCCGLLKYDPRICVGVAEENHRQGHGSQSVFRSGSEKDACCIFVAQEPNSVLGSLTVEVSSTHTHTQLDTHKHTHTPGRAPAKE